MYCVQWDVDSLDWKDPTPEQIKQNIMKKIKNGSIILMHNGAKNTSIDGVYAAGDVCEKNLRQVVTAVGDGAAASTEMERYISEIKKRKL